MALPHRLPGLTGHRSVLYPERPLQRRSKPYVVNPSCSRWRLHCSDKHTETVSNLGREGFNYQRSVHNQEAKAGVEPLTGSDLLICLPHNYPGSLPRNGTAHNGLGLLHQLALKRMSSQACHQANPVRLLPRWLCQVYS